MDINKKNRSDLKSYFVKNSIPTESNFAELIDGMLNQKDDGIVKLSGDPLSIEAAGDLAGLQKVINFYAKFQDANPAWSLQLNPRTDPNAPATAKAGLCVADGSGAARLFIDSNSGNIGVGVVNPNGKLDVAGQIRMGLDEGGSGIRTISFTRDAGDEGNAGKISYRGGFGADFLHIIGAGTSPRKIKLWDNVVVSGALTPSAGNSENNGIMFPKDPGGGGGDAAWLRYYARGGESCTLEIGTSNDPDDHIALMPSGGVGIGTNAPGAKLDILASTTTWGGWYEAIRLSQNAHSAITHPGGGLLFGLHGNRRFYFSDSTEGQHIMVINANPAGGGQVSIGAGDSPIAKLDMAQAARSGTHPTAVKGLYITGDFGEADGVEFRHSNATQGIGFGYNTIYAAGSNANQDLQLKSKGTGDVRILGAANISNGNGYANANNYMSSGSLTVGSINANYGGGNSWNANTAGLLLETSDNTEIAVHDSGTRVASLMYFQGGGANKITIGRDMGWGVSPVNFAGDVALNGNVALGGFTGADADEWPKLTWYRDTPNNWDEGLIKHSSSRGFFGRTGFGIHVHASRDWTFFSTGWDPLFGIEGGTGNTSIKGVLSVPSGIRVDGGTNTHINVDGAFYRYNGQCYITMDDNLYIRDYARGNMCWFNSVNKTNTWSSDLRLKTDVTPMTGMLEKVSALQGVFFKWKDSQSDNKQLGLIAQEVDKVFPELVSTDQEGMMGVNYMGLIAVLIEALKEQQNQVQQLFALVKS